MKQLLILAIVAFSFSSLSAKKTEQPNVIILLADDLGYGELASYGQEVIKTPTIDKLAKEGVRFTDFYEGTSVCSPSRTVLATGLHTGHTSIRGNKGLINGKWDRVPMYKSETTIAEMLKEAGYQTAMIGKWHMGVPEDLSTWANGRGFDYAVQEQWGTSKEGFEYDERWHYVNEKEDSVFYDYTQYSCLDEFRTNFALEYLDEAKKVDKPFFIYMSFRSPHSHEYFLRENDLYKENQQDWPEIERRHAGRITMLDEQVKRILDKLEANGQLDNTFILFTSDNGPHSENHHDYRFFNSSGGLRGYKRDVYEGGVRIPAIAYWKGKIEPKETDHMAAFYDVMPTIADIAGAKAPENTDGISFYPLLKGKKQKEHEFIYWEIQEGRSVKGFHQAVRMGKWKAVRYGDNYKTELYDLDNDVYETNDLSAQHPELVERANELLKRESVKNPHYPYSGGVWKE